MDRVKNRTAELYVRVMHVIRYPRSVGWFLTDALQHTLDCPSRGCANLPAMLPAYTWSVTVRKAAWQMPEYKVSFMMSTTSYTARGGGEGEAAQNSPLRSWQHATEGQHVVGAVGARQLRMVSHVRHGPVGARQLRLPRHRRRRQAVFHIQVQCARAAAHGRIAAAAGERAAAWAVRQQVARAAAGLACGVGRADGHRCVVREQVEVVVVEAAPRVQVELRLLGGSSQQTAQLGRSAVTFRSVLRLLASANLRQSF